MTKTHGGKYYGRTWDGRLEDATAADGPPDTVICRRVADFPHGQPPPGARITRCRDCDQRIAFNPAGPHQDRPRICMQCARIQPLPIEDGER
jgi:hypothetical protein